MHFCVWGASCEKRENEWEPLHAIKTGHENRGAGCDPCRDGPCGGQKRWSFSSPFLLNLVHTIAHGCEEVALCRGSLD